MGSRLFVASRQACDVGAAEVRVCRWLGTVVRLPSRGQGDAASAAGRGHQRPDRPSALAADRHRLWVVSEPSLYRYDLDTRRLTARVPVPGLAVARTSPGRRGQSRC